MGLDRHQLKKGSCPSNMDYNKTKAKTNISLLVTLSWKNGKALALDKMFMGTVPERSQRFTNRLLF